MLLFRAPHSENQDQEQGSQRSEGVKGRPTLAGLAKAVSAEHRWPLGVESKSCGQRAADPSQSETFLQGQQHPQERSSASNLLSCHSCSFNISNLLP